jgi:hypothetical protein
MTPYSLVKFECQVHQNDIVWRDLFRAFREVAIKSCMQWIKCYVQKYPGSFVRNTSNRAGGELIKRSLIRLANY